MKKAIGKVWYFINVAVMKTADVLGKYHIISEKTKHKLIFKAVDNIEFAVLRLMRQRAYRRFSSSVEFN